MPRITQTVQLKRGREKIACPVYAVEPANPDEDFADGRLPIAERIRLYVPLASPRPQPDDWVQVPSIGGLAFRVVGQPVVWDRNPNVSRTRFTGVVVLAERRQR